MGASWFEVEAKGETAKEAFKNAVEDAKYEFGHGGYTGTIAEKSSFEVVSLPDGWQGSYFDLCDYVAEQLPDIDDKWGPAGCVPHPTKEDVWVFFGHASC